MKVNHHSLAYKMQAQPNKTYKDLRQKQKAKIADWMFQSVCAYYKEHGTMPEGEAAEQITVRVYEKIKSLAIWVPYDEVHRTFLAKLPRYETRITENGIPEESPPQKKAAPAPKKKGEQQQGLSELWKENEAAIYRIAALQMRYELEKGCRLL